MSNLLSIISQITGQTIDELVQEFSNKGYGDLKQRAASVTIEQVARPFKLKTEQLLADRAELKNLMHQGAEKAKKVANETLQKVYEKVGFVS